MAVTTIEIAISGSDLTETKRKELEEGMFELEQWMANRIYELSQDTVPVATGFLKRTGQVSLEDGKPMVTYVADYAEVVENGIPGRREGEFFLENAVDTVFLELEGVIPDFIPEGLTISTLATE